MAINLGTLFGLASRNPATSAVPGVRSAAETLAFAGKAAQPPQSGAPTQSPSLPIYTPEVMGASTPTVDPSIAAARNSATGDFTRARDSAFNSVGESIDTAGRGYRSSILDYLGQRRIAQNNVDNMSVQNELARSQGQQGILDMVGNGIKSGGVILANNNAGSSSASDAIARAYGTIGRQESSKVGNQYAQGQNQISTAQDNIFTTDATQKRKSEESKTSTINSIINSTRAQLAELNRSAAMAGIGDRVDIEGKINEVKARALEALSGFDSELSGGMSSQVAKSPDQIRAEANKLLTAGVAPETSFDFTSAVPAQLQGTGQFSSSLPIFTAQNRKRQ